MKNRFLCSITILISVVLMSGCVAYVPPETHYSAPYAVPAPYSAYGVYPAVPPVFIGHGWGNRRYGYYRHH